MEQHIYKDDKKTALKKYNKSDLIYNTNQSIVILKNLRMFLLNQSIIF